MEEKRAFMILILCVASVTSVVANILDVCASCHKNATCDDKSDNSGKVCNCKSGFLGNGRTLCLDKDECQIAASNICGQHAICHNTYGSYYCTCLSGYMASNNMPFFIRNDGTHCQDIDECVVNGLCGEGGHCKNLDGSFECSCHLGYRVHKGVEPFHPIKDQTSCQVVNCGQLTLQQNSLLRSATGTTFGSMATFECDEGFLWKSGNNTSQCGADGLWSKLTMICEAMCGPVPLLAHSEVVWRNGSVVTHRCMNGYHSWRGSNVSVCGNSGEWQRATLKCIEVKPPIHQLLVSNEKCLQWRAEKYEEESEMYRVIYTGSRNYQKAFLDKRKKFVNSKADWLEVCLNLLPATNYTVSITALSAGFTSTTTINTSLTVPAVPVVHYREYETSVPTLRLKRSPNTLDPISLYQVYVLPVEGMMVFDCSSPMNGEALGTSGSSQGCIAAQMHVSHVGPEIEFTVGDGFHYGGFFNAPLEKGRNYYVILRAVSQWKKDSKSSCVLWAKVKGTSYFVKISSLCAAALIGLIALAILLGLAYFRFSKK
ncbi:sushi domain-containing protein 1 isoform X4 [Corythoichthys intestinalis]|uniref:sushi domain-containing protein 1 isoform X4 n=1 Tax=Corythoichthys intestinalis TaxID=161448 RepID=UPI0025A5CD9A|nr:sushi domain-containing protein 1 isoform X4 [Corythoichthys intestinalis]